MRVADLIGLSVDFRVGVVDRLGEAKAAGYSSTSAWLRSGGRMNSRAASSHRQNGRQFHRLSATAAAAAGELSYGMATAIAAAVKVLTDDADARIAEETLLNLARDEFSTVEKVSRAGKYLRQVLNPDGHLRDEERAHRDRYLTARLDEDGSISGSFKLPPEAAARLQALLDAYARKSGADDTRTQSQRNADVLIQLLVQAVTAELLVIVNAETLPDDVDAQEAPADCDGMDDDQVRERGQPDDREEPDDRGEPGEPDERGQPGDGGEPRVGDSAADRRKRWWGGRDVAAILDLGSAVRLAPRWMRRAILATYDICAYDSCPVPAKWCELDHVRPWSSHRSTRLEDIAPACDHHNRDRAKNPHRYEIRRRADGRWHLTTTERYRR